MVRSSNRLHSLLLGLRKRLRPQGRFRAEAQPAYRPRQCPEPGCQRDPAPLSDERCPACVLQVRRAREKPGARHILREPCHPRASARRWRRRDIAAAERQLRSKHRPGNPSRTPKPTVSSQVAPREASHRQAASHIEGRLPNVADCPKKSACPDARQYRPPPLLPLPWPRAVKYRCLEYWSRERTCWIQSSRPYKRHIYPSRDNAPAMRGPSLRQVTDVTASRCVFDLKMGLGGEQHERRNRQNRCRISQYLVRDGFFPGRGPSRALR